MVRDLPSEDRSMDRSARYSLVSLALLVAVLGLLLSCIDVDRLREQYRQLINDRPWRLFVAIASAGVVGGLIGLTKALVARLRWRGLFAAVCCGGLAGQVALVLLFAPGPFGRSSISAGVFLAAILLLRLGAR
jgi:hypothetical protein